MPSFPFFDLHHVLERPPPRVTHQFVMVLVARFHMSVAEIVMAYALVRPHDAATTTRNPAPATRSPYSSPIHQSPRDDQVKQARVRNPSLIRCYSVRPIFLGCCVLAVKVSREADPRLMSSLHSRVQDVFNLLDVTLLSRIEHQLLEVLSSQPAPIAPQPARPRNLFAPQPVCTYAVQVLDWRMPMDAGQYQVYADALFGAAADALPAPPMPDES